MSISKRLVRVLFSAILLVSGPWAIASSFVVSTTVDSIHPGSLRAAIIAANRTGGNNLIRLAPSRGGSVYHLTIPGADEDNARTGDLDITRGSITIIGVGSNVTIDATGLGDRVFQVFPGAHLTLENLIIKGGAAPLTKSLALGEAGGAIYNAGTLTLLHCIITNNASGQGQPLEGNGGGTAGADGGGIYNSGMLSADTCRLVGNSSGLGVDGAPGGNGGGLRNDGRCLLTGCVINGNRAGDGGGPAGNFIGLGGSGGNGGAIYNTGTMIFQNCSIGANSSGDGANGGQPLFNAIPYPGGPGGNGGSGGGIYNTGKIELDFSSIYNNDCGNGGNGSRLGADGPPGSGGSGAGIFNVGVLTLNTSTISGNSAGNGGNGGDGQMEAPAANGGAGGNGGGVYNTTDQQSGSGSLILSSCTITLNVCGAGGNGGNGDPSGFFVSGPPVASGGSGGSGGGVWNQTTNATIQNTLIALNLAGVGGSGGTNTIYSLPTPSSPDPLPQIIVGNAGSNGTGLDLFGSFASQGFNLLGTADGSTGFTNGVNADQLGTDASPIDPLLGPLQMNGGLTPTQALLPGSPAIDQGNSFGIKFDQRHVKRPNDLSTIPNAPGGDGTDIGAFEF